jgi:hypothetical protein
MKTSVKTDFSNTADNSPGGCAAEPAGDREPSQQTCHRATSLKGPRNSRWAWNRRRQSLELKLAVMIETFIGGA